eukprot:1602499-Pyramimonas_sp.AAC.3
MSKYVVLASASWFSSAGTCSASIPTRPSDTLERKRYDAAISRIYSIDRNTWRHSAYQLLSFAGRFVLSDGGPPRQCRSRVRVPPGF